jgi:hypothetical protein
MMPDDAFAAEVRVILDGWDREAGDDEHPAVVAAVENLRAALAEYVASPVEGSDNG